MAGQVGDRQVLARPDIDVDGRHPLGHRPHQLGAHRAARRYSTAGTNWPLRNVFGQEFKPSVICLRVISSKTAAASVPSMSVIAPTGSSSGSVIGTSSKPILRRTFSSSRFSVGRSRSSI